MQEKKEFKNITEVVDGFIGKTIEAAYFVSTVSWITLVLIFLHQWILHSILSSVLMAVLVVLGLFILFLRGQRAKYVPQSQVDLAIRLTKVEKALGA